MAKMVDEKKTESYVSRFTRSLYKINSERLWRNW